MNFAFFRSIISKCYNVFGISVCVKKHNKIIINQSNCAIIASPIYILNTHLEK